MFSLKSELTHDTASQALREATSRIDAGENQVDCSGLARFDSAALAVLLALRRHAARRGVSLGVHHLPEGLASLAEVYGVDHLLTPS